MNNSEEPIIAGKYEGYQIITSGEIEDETEELTFDEKVALEREKLQPTKLETFFALSKSLILRALVVYFIMTFFRRPSTPDAEVEGTGLFI